jgi:hypothetical protein
VQGYPEHRIRIVVDSFSARREVLADVEADEAEVEQLGRRMLPAALVTNLRSLA